MEPAGGRGGPELDLGGSALTRSTPVRSFPKHIVIPQQHGAWALWLGPFAVGAGAAGTLRGGLAWLFVCILGIFLAMQPLTVAVKVLSGRKNRLNLGPALAWLAVYGLVALTGAAGLVRAGDGRLLWVGLAAAPVLAWQVSLVARKAERGNLASEIALAGLLALAAPAAYWTGGGDLRTGLLLWMMCGLQSAAAIVHVYLLLAYRRMRAAPGRDERIRRSAPTHLFHGVNLGCAIGLAAAGWIPWLASAAFGAMLAEAVYSGFLRPPVGARPAAIGIRQMAATAVFSVLLIAAYAKSIA